MLFHTQGFVLFFLIFFAGYWAMPGHRTRMLWLLVGSVVFYMHKVPWHILLILGSASVDFLVALRLEDEFALSAAARGLVLTGLGVAGLVTARLVGSAADRIGPRRTVLIGAAVGIVVLVGVGLAPTVGLVAAAWALGGD